MGAVVAAVAAAALGLAACGADDTTTDSGSSTAGNVDIAGAQTVADQYTKAVTEITQKKALSKPVPTGKKIIFANSGLPATQLIQGGVKDAAAALGWGFETVTYENANPATLQSALRTALSKKPDAVIIAGNAPATYGAATLQAFKDAKVPLIVGSVCPLTVADPLVAGMAGCEVEEAAGKALANWFIADSKGKGKALFVNVKAIPSLAAFVKAFSTEVDAKCETCDVQVLEATLTQVAENQIVPSAVNKLRSDPSFNYLLFDNAQFSKGITPALKAAGISDKITVGGRSADEGAIGALKAGARGAWTAMPYNVLGYGNVDAVVRTLLGETDAQPVIPPVQLLTSKNSADVQVPFRAPQDALEQYKKIWGIS
jgi:ribose transport system substrate-binding protein